MKEDLSRNLDLYRGLRTKMNVLHDPFTSCIPLEIATTIFHFFLQTESNTASFFLPPDGERTHALFTLGAVCKSWRRIVWSTPHFWTQISIFINPATIAASTGLVQNWLARSGQLPLSIQIYAPPAHFEANEDSVDEVRPLSRLINACSSRWEYLDLRLPSILLPMFQGDPSNLRDLRIQNSSETGDSSRVLLTSKDGQKPKPSHVGIGFVSFDALSQDISWSNVTCVEAKAIDLRECFELLRQAPRLTECNFTMIKAPVDAWAGAGRVTHRNIVDLKILLPLGYHIIQDLLDHLILPHLQFLGIQLHDSPLPTRNILSLIERSSCPLGSLEVSAILKEDALVSMLREIPSLWGLSVTPSIFDHNFSAVGLFNLLSRTSRIAEDDDEKSDTEARADGGTGEVAEAEAEISSNILTVDEPEFLPELEYFRYSQSRPDDCERIWDLIPDAVGYSERKKENFDPNLSIRPLTSLLVTLDPPVGMMAQSLRAPEFISQPTPLRVEELLEQGFNLDVEVSLKPLSEPQDFIASSIAFHEKAGLEVGQS